MHLPAPQPSAAESAAQTTASRPDASETAPDRQPLPPWSNRSFLPPELFFDESGKLRREEPAAAAEPASREGGVEDGMQAAVQARAAGPGMPGASPAAEGAAQAARSVACASEPLPHREAIQASFGPHDISGIRAQTGGAAGDAAEAMGASAFATGNTVGFGGPPSLHTAAHEAAHVVQQRGGVQLKDGVGRPGDAYERHADAVADRVVRGESAETLLDQVAGGNQAAAGATQAAAAVQARPDPAVHDHAGKLRQLAEAAGQTRQARNGEIRPRPPVSGDVDTQSVGEDFARSLGDDELEQTIEYLIQRRDDPQLQPVDREVAAGNLAVLAAESRRRGRPSGALDRDAVRTLLVDASIGASELAPMLRAIAQNPDPYSLRAQMGTFIEHAVDRLAWVVSAIGASLSYLDLAGRTGQGGVGVLGMAATRAHAAHVGLAILRPWCALLQLHDQVAMLRVLNIEYRHHMLASQQGGVDGVFTPIARFDPDDVAAASADVPGRVAALRTAFDTTVAEAERGQKAQALAMQVQGAMELATFAVSLRGMFAMRGPPSAMSFPMPVMAGASGGAATMRQIVVSAEWIAAIRHLVEIGAITAAGATEALRVRGFTVAMAQASDLPPSVKDLLGEGPTADGMKVTDASRAGVARPPRHHVLPQEERPFFKERGFTGDLDIDNFCVEMGAAEHQALHGGGNWRLGRTWSGEWNRLVMETLGRREQRLGRRLTVAEIMQEVQRLMKDRDVPIRFVPYRGDG